MKAGKWILSILAGTSVGIGGGLLVRQGIKAKKRFGEKRRWMSQVLRASVLRLAEENGSSFSASEIYYFIWILERVCHRHKVAFPDFVFRVEDGMLFSPRLTRLLRIMLRDGRLRLEGDRLSPQEGAGGESLDRLDPTLAAIIDETAGQWLRDFPDEPLVRFGKLFR
ncbi:hypothetical protein LLH00_07095 [bacterium]|nr:hypothetical protein [bacterium]